MNNYAILDLETTNNEVFGKTANPFFNDIVAYSIKTKDSQYTHYIDRQASWNQDEDVTLQLSQYTVLVAHNAKFELSYLWDNEVFQDWLKKGGKVWCTQLAEYYLTNFKTQWASLRDIAVNKYGCIDRRKHIDDLLFKKIEKNDYKCVSELPKDLVLEDVANDVLDTEQVYLEQLKQVAMRGQGFRNLLETQMQFLIATTEMEMSGFCIDKTALNKNKLKLEQELVVVNKELMQLVNKYWKIYEHTF